MKKFAALVAVVALVAFAAPAFAANPFMDVPMNHWAYDAVSQLASRGVVSGYPDGAFKGEWKATRYEMASVVARALAYVDMNKASKQDLELLKKLVVEFKDELDALGVKVDELDSRVAVLEEGVGGWKIGGEFRFDAKWADKAAGVGANVYGLSTQADSDTDFVMSRYRLHLWKQIDDKVKFYARINGSADNNDVTVDNDFDTTTLKFDKYYLTVAFPWDITANIGRYCLNWEYIAIAGEGEAVYWDNTRMGYYFDKAFSMGSFSAFVARSDSNDVVATALDDYYLYGARIAFAFNEYFGMDLNWMKMDFDSATQADYYTAFVQAQVNFTPDLALKAAYYKQDVTAADPTAWRVILDANEEFFGGFTSLWIEYANYEAGFTSANGATYELIAGGQVDFGALATDLDVLDIYAVQTWNDKWTTWVRYLNMDYNAVNADVTEWTVAVKYFYTPALSFELAYDKYDSENIANEDDLIRFRTYVSF